MKNIKLRAWDDVNNRMIYDFYNFSKENQFKTEEGCYSCGISADKNVITASLSLQKHDDFAFRHVKYIELMQCTGLKDKNNVEIFEGDIVRGENKAHEKELIVQKFGTTYHLYEVVAGVKVAKRPYCRIDSRATYNDFSSSETDLEVIGNIYENSDLLEATK